MTLPTRPINSPSATRRWSPALRAIALVALVVWLATLGEPVWGATGRVVHLPTRGVKPRNGLELELDTHWVTGSGNRPVQVTISTSPPVPATRDHSIRVRLAPNAWSDMHRSLSVEQTFELPAGATSVTTSILMPQHEEWEQLRIEVWKNGRRIDELCDVEDVSDSVSGITEFYPALLVVDNDAPTIAQRWNLLLAYQRMIRFGKESQPPAFNLPDLRGLPVAMAYAGSTTRHFRQLDARPSDLELLVTLEDVRAVDVLPPAELPEQWIGLNGLDQILISFPDLQRLIGQQPTRWQALRAWAAAGGTLLITQLGEEHQELGKLEQLLQLPPLPTATGLAPAQTPDARYRNWKLPQRGSMTSDVHKLTWRKSLEDLGLYDFGPEVEIGEELALTDLPPEANDSPRPGKPRQTKKRTPQERVPPAPEHPPFAWRELGMGLVVAIGPGDEFTGSDQQWGWMINSLPVRNTLWVTRHGVSTHQENHDYWNFLIPGVGTAPVTSFRVLITLFVIVIGPVNYFVLRRRHKLQWMMITIPAGALLVTLGLLGYALLTDGLSTRLRVRSYTELDQRHRHVVSWSRQCYYAALAPSRGLTFPADTSVTPIDRMPQNQYGIGEPYQQRRALQWHDAGSQQLASGYIQSRVAAQFLVIRSSTSTAELLVGERPAEAPLVENRLGSRIQRLILSDSQGKYFTTQSLAAGQSATLTPLEPADYNDWSRSFAAAPLEDPAGFDRDLYHNSMWQRSYGYRNYRSYSQYTSEIGMPQFFTSLLESKLKTLKEDPWQKLSSRTYLALVESGVDTPVGTTTRRDRSSYEVIRGRW